MSTTYVVTLDLRTVGSLNMSQGRGSPGAARAQQQQWTSVKDAAIAAERAFRGARMMHDVGQKLLAPFDAAANAVWNLTKVGGAVAGTAIFAGLTYGVMTLNNELEKAELSMASVFKTYGFANSIPGGLEKAKDTIKQMRVDARELPGEFEDLQRTYMNGANAAFRAGADPDRWRKTAALANAVGLGEFQMEKHMLSREVAQLLEGRAGAHNIFGVRLAGLVGDRAKQFNKMGAGERLSFVEEELSKRSESLFHFKQTLDTAANTLKDHGKIFATTATEPLARAVKHTLFEINDWITANQTRVDAWANFIGTHATAAFEWAKEKLMEWGPALGSFASNLYDEFAQLKDQLMPVFTFISDFLKELLGGDKRMTWAETLADPKAAAAVTSMVKGYAALKGMEFAGSGVLTLLQVASGAFNIFAGMKALGLLGASGATVAAGTAGGAGAAMTSGAGLGALGALGVGAAALAPLGMMAYAAHDIQSAKAERAAALAYESKTLADTWMSEQGRTGVTNIGADIAHLGFLKGTNRDGMSVTDIHKLNAEINTLENRISSYRSANEQLNETLSLLNERKQHAAAAALELAFKLSDAGTAAATFAQSLGGWWERQSKDGGLVSSDLDRNFTPMFMPHLEVGEIRSKKDGATPKHPGGAGGTTVQKVEIVVTSNQNASRVARLTANEIAKLYRHPKISPHAPPGSR